jgi:propionate CoA-transferase
LIVTERAVFRVERDGLALIEVAAGIDVKRQILEQMDFALARIASPLVTMDRKLFM